MTACHDKLLLLHAHVDGELDAANALALETHLRTCTGCAEELTRIEALGRLLTAPGLARPAPAALRRSLEAMGLEAMAAAPASPAASSRVPQRDSSPRRWRPLGGALAIGRNWSGGLVTGLAISAALVLALPQFTRVSMQDQLLANHIRSLSLSSHLTDVATSNRHVVKPWFNGKIDFAPPVPELAEQGFPLVGGRLDYLDGRAVAVIVYKRQLHSIDVFVRPAGTLSLPLGVSAKRDGFSLVRWTSGGLEFWAVSDVELAELNVFRQAFVRQPSL